MTGKTNPGNFFEDFRLGQDIIHATPRTVTAADQALYTALYGSRFLLQSSDEAARAVGYRCAPLDDLLAFHVVFGKTVPDISLNAVANLGYADCRWQAPVSPGDTLSTRSTVIGLRENANRKSGIVYVRSTGRNQHGETVLDYVRWVMVKKSREDAPTPETVIPDLPDRVDPARLIAPAGTDFSRWDDALSGSPYRFEDYRAGEVIDHVDGMTIEEAEHQLATRLYQNTAKVHFNQLAQDASPLGRRLIYGGHVISLARALTFNGLGNAVLVAAINGGRHVNPTLADHTIHAWSEVVETAELPGRRDLGALRLRTLATRDLPCTSHPDRDEDGKYPESVVLDLDYWVLMPRR